MSEDVNTTEQGTQTENTGEADVQGSRKLFTQEEVNGFVQSRISRMRGQIEKENRAAYDQKLQELQAREMKLLVKERLQDRGMSKELADVITCTDEQDLDNKLNMLQKIYGGTSAKENKPSGFIQIGAANDGGAGIRDTDPVRKAMGLN